MSRSPTLTPQAPTQGLAGRKRGRSGSPAYPVIDPSSVAVEIGGIPQDPASPPPWPSHILQSPLPLYPWTNYHHEEPLSPAEPASPLLLSGGLAAAAAASPSQRLNFAARLTLPGLSPRTLALSPSQQPVKAPLPPPGDERRVRVKKVRRRKSVTDGPIIVRNDKPLYLFGNYDNYYQYRYKRTTEIDGRLEAILKKFGSDMFKSKRVIDIGCNCGFITFYIAAYLSAQRVVGIDIDKDIILRVLKQLRKFKHDGIRLDATAAVPGVGGSTQRDDDFPAMFVRRSGPAPVTNKQWSINPAFTCRNTSNDFREHFPFNIEFRAEDIAAASSGGGGGGGGIGGGEVEEELWVSATGRESELYDYVIAFSVTKWIHFHNGDEGLKSFFFKAKDLLVPGGRLLLEPQYWRSYKTNVIHQLKPALASIQFRPDQFKDFLINTVGFTLVDVLRPDPASVGLSCFHRQIYVFEKPRNVVVEG